MSIERIKEIVDENKKISIYKTSGIDLDRGNYVCKIETAKDSKGKHPKGDSVYYLYADSFEELLLKIERKH